MKSFAIFLLFFVMNFFACEAAAAKEVSCESVGNDIWGDPVGNQNACLMNRVTTIDSYGFTIGSAKDETIGVLDFDRNKKVSFLPVNVNEKFPNLVALYAGYCSIKTISKENFKNMNKLKVIYLHHNQIEIIKTNVFEDLTSLEQLDLERNKIKSINGQTFQHLKKLKGVELSGNECINENFDPSKIATLMQVVSQKCGFSESDDAAVMRIGETSDQVQELAEKSYKPFKTNMSAIEELMKETAELKAELKTIQEKESFQKEVACKLSTLEEKTSENAELKAKLNLAEGRITFIREVYEELDVQRNETLAAKTKYLQAKFEMKKGEIVDMLSEMQRKVDEKQQKIEKLQEEIKTVKKYC